MTKQERKQEHFEIKLAFLLKEHLSKRLKSPEFADILEQLIDNLITQKIKNILLEIKIWIDCDLGDGIGPEEYKKGFDDCKTLIKAKLEVLKDARDIRGVEENINRELIGVEASRHWWFKKIDKLIDQTRQEIIDEFLKGKRCYNCGQKKTPDPLCDTCGKCLEEE